MKNETIKKETQHHLHYDLYRINTAHENKLTPEITSRIEYLMPSSNIILLDTLC